MIQLTTQQIEQRNSALLADYMCGFSPEMIQALDNFWQNTPSGTSITLGAFGALTKTSDTTAHFQPFNTPGIYSAANDFQVGQPLAYVTCVIPALGAYLAQLFNQPLPAKDSSGNYTLQSNPDGTPNNWTGTVAEWQAAPRNPWLAAYGSAANTGRCTELLPAVVPALSNNATR